MESKSIGRLYPLPPQPGGTTYHTHVRTQPRMSTRAHTRRMAWRMNMQFTHASHAHACRYCSLPCTCLTMLFQSARAILNPTLYQSSTHGWKEGKNDNRINHIQNYLTSHSTSQSIDRSIKLIEINVKFKSVCVWVRVCMCVYSISVCVWVRVFVCV